MAERYHILGRMIPCGAFCPVWWKFDAEPTKCWASGAWKGVWTLQDSCWRRQTHRVEFGVQFYILPEPAALAGSSSPALTPVHLPRLQPLLLYWTELHGLLTAQQFSPNEGSNCQWWEEGRGKWENNKIHQAGSCMTYVAANVIWPHAEEVGACWLGAAKRVGSFQEPFTSTQEEESEPADFYLCYGSSSPNEKALQNQVVEESFKITHSPKSHTRGA